MCTTRRSRRSGPTRSSSSSARTSKRSGRSRSHEVKIRLLSVFKRFAGVTAVDGASLEIGDGELFTLLGPSGCGETTLLRLIAGFYAPDGGEIWFGDRRGDALRPYARNIGMGFQNYTLWPHMTAQANVANGLKLRKVGAAD